MLHAPTRIGLVCCRALSSCTTALIVLSTEITAGSSLLQYSPEPKMSTCCGFGRKSKSADTEPLLPRYEDETARQRRLHQKLHTYQMIRALSKGYMPSTEQTIINLRTLLASDVLNANNKDLSQSGRRLVRNCREVLKQFIELLLHKNSGDQIQDFIWYLTKSRVYLDLDDVSRQASKAKAKADVSASKIIILTK